MSSINLRQLCGVSLKCIMVGLLAYAVLSTTNMNQTTARSTVLLVVLLAFVVSMVRDNQIKEIQELRAQEAAEIFKEKAAIAKSIALRIADAVGVNVSEYSEEDKETEVKENIPGGVMTGDKPGYYLLNDNKYSTDGIPYEKVSKIIEQSKSHDMYHQLATVSQDELNKQIYFGKARAPLHYESVY